MSASAVSTPAVAAPSKGLNIGLWVVQILLGLAFGSIGLMKITTPVEELAKGMAWITSAGSAGPLLVRFIGVSELAAGFGLILPAAIRVLPFLTPLAGALLGVVMVLAAGVHVLLGEFSALPVNFVLGGLSAFVAWGRFKKAPIAPR